jgi:hypothetical protein
LWPKSRWKRGLRWFQVCKLQKLLLIVALNHSHALWLAFGFCQKQK